MSNIKLKSIDSITSQGVGMNFEGLPAFNRKWFSWEHIASTMLGKTVEAPPFDSLPSKSTALSTPSVNDELRSDLLHSAKEMLSLLRDGAEGKLVSEITKRCEEAIQKAGE